MGRNPPHRNCASWTGLSICALILAATATAVMWAQGSSSQHVQAQAQVAQYPPGRPQPIAVQCQNALADRITADARRRVTVDLNTQSPYSPSNGLQGLRGKLRYGIEGPNTWRSDLRLRGGRSPESRGTRHLYSAGQQQQLAGRAWVPGWARWSRNS
jgi:hypothetical protein